MDRNQAIGLTLIFLLLSVYFLYLAPNEQQQAAENQQKTEQTTSPNKQVNESKAWANVPDSLLGEQLGMWAAGTKGETKEVTIENNDIAVTLNTQGGQIQKVVLKNYKTPQQKPIELLSPQNNQMKWTLPTQKGDIQLKDLFFTIKESSTQAVTFYLQLAEGKFIEQKYTLDKDGFVLKYSIDALSVASDLKKKSLALSWLTQIEAGVETDDEQNRIRSTVNYYTEKGDFDQLSETSEQDDETLEEPIKWFSLKQRFFNVALITDRQFEKASFTAQVDKNNPQSIKNLSAQVEVPVSSLAADANMRFFLGPNDFYLNKEIAEGFDNNVYLGWAVVVPFTRFFIIPLFGVLENVTTSYGLIIILLVAIVRLVLSPLTYKSYISSAKMKVIQPELAALKEKYGDNMQGYSQEQMKLFSETGVNPFSGCLPILLQMPIFLALFTFFPNAIQLRQESFLWAVDLSTFDSILTLPFTIPGYGAHISLFTLLMAVSQIFITLYTTEGQSMATPNNSPINMKFMMYGMPIMFMFMLNSYPSGLTLYYFVSNVFALLQTFVIRKFIIDEDKIKAIIEKNRQNSAKGENKKSSFLQRLESIQKQQQENRQEQQNKKKNKD